MKTLTSLRRHLGWHIFVPLTLVVLAIFALVHIQRARRAAPWREIQLSGVLRVATDASYPPFEFTTESGEIVGLDIDLAAALAQRWNVKLKVFNIHFDGLYDALRADKCDLVISALPYDPLMTRDVCYSQPYFVSGQVLLTRSGVLSNAEPETLRGKRIAVEIGSEAHMLARQLERDYELGLQLAVCLTPEEGIEQLRQGQVDGLICDRIAAASYLSANHDLILLEPPLTHDPFVIATSIDSCALIEHVNEALSEWQTTGQLDAWIARWLRSAYKRATPAQ